MRHRHHHVLGRRQHPLGDLEASLALLITAFREEKIASVAALGPSVEQITERLTKIAAAIFGGPRLPALGCDAEDLVQEFFCRYQQSVIRGKGLEQPVFRYAYRVFLSVCWTQWRRDRIRRCVSLSWDCSSSSCGPLAAAILADFRELLLCHVCRLPAPERRALFDKHLRQWAVAEAARRRGVSPATINRLRRSAYARLREWISADELPNVA